MKKLQRQAEGLRQSSVVLSVLSVGFGMVLVTKARALCFNKARWNMLGKRQQ